jgi:hypothetical protein
MEIILVQDLLNLENKFRIFLNKVFKLRNIKNFRVIRFLVLFLESTKIVSQLFCV